MPGDLSPQFTLLLAEFLEEDQSKLHAARLGMYGNVAELLTLLMELRERSPKAAALAVRALPGLIEFLPEAELLLWVDLAVALSEHSGAIALKYCAEAETSLKLLSPEGRGAVLRVALELADQDAALALEGFRTGGDASSMIGVDALSSWALIGADLARWDYVVGVEYFRRSPEALRVLSIDDLKAWASVSLKLVVPNTLGKPDYMGALTYMRTSAALLAELPSPGSRQRLLTMVGALADRGPALAIELMGEAPGLLRRLPTAEWQERVLRYGLLVADKDPEAAVAYVRRAYEVLTLIGDNAEPSLAMERFEDWFKAGMEVLDLNPEAARAYFATETRKAMEALERAASGVALKDVVRVLKFFAEGLSGKPLTIRQHDGEVSSSQTTSGEGIIGLPIRMQRYPGRSDNLRMYKLMTAHQAGRFEYGTYDLDLNSVEDLAAQACLRYGRAAPTHLRSLEDLFHCYPQPSLIRDIWKLAEDARIDARLKAEYPGLRRDMEDLLGDELPKRTLTHGMSVKEMIVELLLQLSADWHDAVRIPFALEDVVTRAWALLRSVAHSDVSAEGVLRAVHRAYVLIEELTAASESASEGEPAEPSDLPDTPREGESQGGAYRPLENLAYRGPVAIQTGPAGAEVNNAPAHPGAAKPAPSPVTGSLPSREPSPTVAETERPACEAGLSAMGSSPGGSEPPEACPQPVSDETEALSEGSSGPKPGEDRHIFFYDEWDGRIVDYRSNWCRVIEETAAEGSGGFVERTRTTHGRTIALIRRYFEGIRPSALRRLRRQSDGEEVDLEAVIESLVEQRAQTSPTEDVYIRKDRRERDVAVAFLVDLSGSTGRQIGPDGQRIIDVEKDGLVLLAEGLEAIGDQYALYGYSGQSRNQVKFLLLKDFDERYGPTIWRRIDAVRPLVQNRDGAAIRHAAHRLLERSARVKLLILLSDGRPLDDLYGDEYALEDTKAALQEARAKGIHPFCVTVDHEESGYLARMYGDVSYMIIDRVQSLPERLPRIYRMLTT